MYDHKAYMREYNKKYRQSNAEALRQSKARYREDHAETIAQYMVQYRIEHKEIRQQQDNAAARALKLEIFANYGLQCSLCPESRFGALHLDHIGGGGRQHRQGLNADGSPFYRWLKQAGLPPGYRTLCANCNWLDFISRCTSYSTHPKSIARRMDDFDTKLSFFNMLGAICIGCGNTDLRVLTVNHIDKNGAEHRRLISNGVGGGKFYAAILKLDDFAGLECMCFSCNDNFSFGV